MEHLLYVKVYYKFFSLIIGAVYLPPDSDINVYNLHTDSLNGLLNNNINSKFLILGDYYLLNISWQYVNDTITPPPLALISHLESNVLAG